MDFIFDAALDQWHDWETTGTQWLLLNGNYPPDRVGQVWVSDVVLYEVVASGYQRQLVAGATRIVDTTQHRVTYDCDDPDFGDFTRDALGVSKLCLAKVGAGDGTSLLLAAYDLSDTGTGPLQPPVGPDGVYWVAPAEP